MRVMSTTTGWPAMSLPSASVSGESDSSYTCEAMISDRRTVSRNSFGISMPTEVLPGIFSTTRRLMTDSERARSRCRAVICEALMPAAGSISNRVMTGPGWTATTCASMLKSSSFFSSRRAMLSSDCFENCTVLAFSGRSSSDSGGNSPGAGRSNSGTCFSFCTRLPSITFVTTGSMRGGGCFSRIFMSSATVWRRSFLARMPMMRSTIVETNSRASPNARMLRRPM